MKELISKVSDKELKELQELVTTVNKLKLDIGTIEAQKHGLLSAVFQAGDMINAMQAKFKKAYGTSNVNIQDGTLTFPEEDGGSN